MSSAVRTADRAAAPHPSAPRTVVHPPVPDDCCATFPKEFHEREGHLIRERRTLIGDRSALPDESVGVALSGGGVRSATFNLGFLQAMAAHRVLRTIDYLSTVSGGGYIGSFLGRFYTRFINRPKGAVDVVEARLSDDASPEISWLRRCSGYMTVAGVAGAPVTTAVVLRSFLTVHAVIGALLVVVFNLFNLFRYWAVEGFLNHLRPWLSNATRLSLPVDFITVVDPWLLLLALVVVTCFLPLSIAYWLPSFSRPQSYERSRLLAFVICNAIAFMMLLKAGAWTIALGLLVTTIAAFIWVEAAWATAALKTPDATGSPAGRAMVRAKFGKWLAWAMWVAATVLGIEVLDELALRLDPAMPVTAALGVFCLTFAFLFGPLRWMSLRLFTGAAEHRLNVRSLLLAAASLALLLIQWDLVSHAMFQHGADIGAGIVWTAVSFAISVLLGRFSGTLIVNWSSLQLLSAARGSRTYLGASNPYRQTTAEGADVTSPQPEDDIAFSCYRPDLAGGPLHLINVFVNRSVDMTSAHRTSDRQGENMAVGPSGVSVGPDSHGIWVAGEERDDARSRLRAVDPGDLPAPDLPAPFVPRRDSQERPCVIQTSPMQLSDWMSISGSAFSPDQSAGTRLGTSLIYGLANVRAGFWWDSGIEDGDRAGEPIPSTARRFWRWFKRWFRTQEWLLAEFTGWFVGPWRRYWYLSDGGSADALGLYELVRRQVPIIICADATRDVDGGLAALANAVRRVHIDFGAEIEFLSPAELEGLGALPRSVGDALGTLDEIRSAPDGRSRKHAAIARVRYHGSSEQSVLLYVKATMTGDEPVDVLEYQRQHHRFPDQSVLDQSLDEAQWESYRKLGRHSANPLFSPGVRWLADVRRTLSSARRNGDV